ncbi:MAG: hypothetical protein OEY97_07180 [Nitrospirota bacterium]|nr:hypothetical protein [Nitrospirota bacterium]
MTRVPSTSARLTLAALAAAVALTGCATQKDLELTIAELDALRQRQQDQYRQMTARLDQRASELAASQSDLSASQTEFRAEAESIASQVARLGKEQADTNTRIQELQGNLKGLQNVSTIGLGSLSERLDHGDTQLGGRLDAQAETMEKFAMEAGARIDAHTESLTTLDKKIAELSRSIAAQQKDLAALTKKLDALGKKLSSELSALSKSVASGGGGANLAALQKQIDFLGEKLPAQVDAQAKSLKDIQSLLADLNKRVRALEGR